MTIELPRPDAAAEPGPRALHAADPFALVFEHSPVGVAVGRPGGEIVYVNQTMCRLLGKPREDITVASFIEASHPEHKSGVRRLLRAVEGGPFQTFVRASRFHHESGTVVNARFHVGATRNADVSFAYLFSPPPDLPPIYRPKQRERSPLALESIRSDRSSIVG